MSKLPLVARLLLGLIFFVFGLNGFLHFIPTPPPPEGPAGTLLAGFIAAGYFLPVVAGTQVLSGALLLAGQFVPLALTLLAPVIVQILLFHAFLAPAAAGWPVPLLALACEVYLAFAYKSSFAPMLRRDARPGA